MSKHEGGFQDRRSGGSLAHSSIPRSRSRDERELRKRDNDRDNDRDYPKSNPGARSDDDSKPRDRRRSRSRSPYNHERCKRRRLTADNRSPTHRREESTDSRGRRSRRRSTSTSSLSEHRHRDSRRKRKNSDRHRSISFSPSPKRGQRGSRTANDGASHRRSQSLSPPSKPQRIDSRDDYKHPSRHRSASPIPRRHPSPPIRSKAPLPSQHQAYNKDPTSTTTAKPPEPEKQKPNYAPTGKLAAETNTVAGTSIVLKYNEPPEARLPPASAPWRLYVFKGPDLLETIPLSTRSCWLFGRERAVVDFPTEHPSCSKQHAVLQFRHVEKKNEYGDKVGGVKPYVIDLDSANGTRVNGEGVEGRRYVEVMSGDVVTFGESTREYVVMLPPKE